MFCCCCVGGGGKGADGYESTAAAARESAGAEQRRSFDGVGPGEATARGTMVGIEMGGGGGGGGGPAQPAPPPLPPDEVMATPRLPAHQMGAGVDVAAARLHAHNVAPVSCEPPMPPGPSSHPWQEASLPPMPKMPAPAQPPPQPAASSDISGDARTSALVTSILNEHRGSVESIRAEHKRMKARLREYELAFEQQHGRKPRKKKDWQPVFEEYERYAALREAEKLAQLNAGQARRSSGSI